ncbi:MAG: ABC transporter substrate-binding protein [Paraclostridium sp.]
MKISKRIISLMLSGTMLFTVSGCAKTKDQVTEGGGGAGGSAPTLKLLAMSSGEKDANIVRDQLSKAGFKVELNIQPDYSSFVSQEEAGNYDLAITGWTTVTGNPDYAVRSLFKSGGDSNRGPIKDSEVDALIDKAATQTSEEYVQTYKELENKLVTENAYIVPLHSAIKTQAINKDVVKDVRLSKSRSMVWEAIDFVDESKRATDPLLLSQTASTLTSLDPIKGNDGSINMLNTNMYVRLVNLTDDDVVTSEGSLSYNHAIGEGNKDYYFVLRDDINFAKVNDKKAVDSGEKVGAEDVVFSLNRAKDPKSVPDHRTYSLHESMENVEIITDLASLESTKVSGSDQTIKEALEAGLEAPISSLTESKDGVNNGLGSYQVVKVITKNPFPQVLNYLAHQSGGIVSKKQVESVNTYDVATYDRSKDIAYGDQTTVTEGATYNNTLATSGPYIMTYKNDYEAIFEKNPAYMVGTENEPKIQTVKVKFIKDLDSQLSSLRSGEIHTLYGVPDNKYDLVKEDSKLQLQEIKGNGVSYMVFNMRDGQQCANEDLRKAVLNAINQDEFLAVYNGAKFKAYSTLSTLVDTGNELKQDLTKSKEHLETFNSSK